jgi:hypothetical protein
VQIEVAVQSRDRYGRLLGSIWRDGVLVQEQLVREGLCLPYVVPPNVEYIDRIRAAGEQARRDGLGIYARELPASRIPAAVPSAPVEHCSAVTSPPRGVAFNGPMLVLSFGASTCRPSFPCSAQGSAPLPRACLVRYRPP